MFCTNCGKNLEGQESFCPSCGVPVSHLNQVAEDNLLPIREQFLEGTGKAVASKENTMAVDSREITDAVQESVPIVQTSVNSSSTSLKVNAPRGGLKKILIVISGIVAALLIGFVILSHMGNVERDAAIKTIRSGYLGCYTDVTVEEFIMDAFEGYNITWDGGVTDDGDLVIDAFYTGEDGQQGRIQWMMLTEDTFRFNGIYDWGNEITSLDDAVETLNMMYYLYYMEDLEIDEAVAKLNTCSCAAVLCGASKSYSGDRENLYREAFDLEYVPATAANYLDLLELNEISGGNSSDTYYPDIAGNWEDSWSQRATMTVTYEGDYYYSVDVLWSSSASEYDEWVFSGYYDPSTGELSYDNGNWYTYAEDESGYLQEGWILDNMQGILYFDDDGILHWNDYSSVKAECDFGSSNMRFEQFIY